MMNVAVIGAGVSGLVCATELLEAGFAVDVYEAGPGLGAHACSWYAGGMLAPWCEAENAEPVVVEMGKASASWWQKHTGLVREHGTLVLALGRDRADLQQFASRTTHYTRLNAEQVFALEPDLENRFQQGLFFEGEAHLDPRLALQKLQQNLTASGCNFHFGHKVDAADIDAEIIIDCRGLSARDTLPELRGVKGEMMLIHSDEIRLQRPVRLLHPRIPIYVVPRENGIYMVGATMLESDNTTRISLRSTLELLSAVYALHPAFGEAEIIETGVNARPAFADNIPRVEKRGNILYVNGLYRHGFLLAPEMARQVTGLCLKEIGFSGLASERVLDENCA